MSQAPPSLAEVAQNLSLVANETQSQQDEAKLARSLNSKLLDICARAIEQASEAPPVIKDWRDLKTAREIMAAASGTDTQKPLVNLIFPPSLDGQASEPPGYIRISDITAAKQQGQQAPAMPEPVEALPTIALHALAAHERALAEATGAPCRGRAASA